MENKKEGGNMDERDKIQIKTTLNGKKKKKEFKYLPCQTS